MSKTELETLPELEQKMNMAKKHLFLLFDFATLSPQEVRLNSSTFSWSGHIVEVVHDSKLMIDEKMRQFQESLRLRRERLIEDLQSFALQVSVPCTRRWKKTRFLRKFLGLLGFKAFLRSAIGIILLSVCMSVCL